MLAQELGLEERIHCTDGSNSNQHFAQRHREMGNDEEIQPHVSAGVFAADCTGEDK